MSVSNILKFFTSVSGGVKSLTLITKDGKTHEISESDARFERTRSYAAESLWEDVYREFMNEETREMIQKFHSGSIEEGAVKNEDGTFAIPELTAAIKKIASQGMDPTYMEKFQEKLSENHVPHVRDNLYRFIAHHNIKICDDGDFLCVKIVNKDYTDCHTGKIYNRPGDVVYCEWDDVDIDPNKSCSKGLHVCAPHYIRNLTGIGRKVVLVKQNPKNIGSIPNDYTLYSKIRGVGYEVLADITDKFSGDMDLSKINLQEL